MGLFTRIFGSEKDKLTSAAYTIDGIFNAHKSAGVISYTTARMTEDEGAGDDIVRHKSIVTIPKASHKQFEQIISALPKPVRTHISGQQLTFEVDGCTEPSALERRFSGSNRWHLEHTLQIVIDQIRFPDRQPQHINTAVSTAAERAAAYLADEFNKRGAARDALADPQKQSAIKLEKTVAEVNKLLDTTIEPFAAFKDKGVTVTAKHSDEESGIDEWKHSLTVTISIPEATANELNRLSGALGKGNFNKTVYRDTITLNKDVLDNPGESVRAARELTKQFLKQIPNERADDVLKQITARIEYSNANKPGSNISDIPGAEQTMPDTGQSKAR